MLVLFHHGIQGQWSSRSDDASLRLHGMIGNLLDETESFLSGTLGEHGLPSMTINTVLPNLGLVYEFGLVDAVLQQISFIDPLPPLHTSAVRKPAPSE